MRRDWLATKNWGVSEDHMQRSACIKSHLGTKYSLTLNSSIMQRDPFSYAHKESRKPTPPINLTISEESFSTILSAGILPKQETDRSRAKKLLQAIQDPLWKHVCSDIINMMGPASLLKIADSTLGEVYFQSENIEVFCKCEETAKFIQQYDFVILGSLHSYLPTLKQLKTRIVD